VKFIDQSFSKETILWRQHKYKTLSKILHFGAGKVLRLKSNSSTNAFPYLQHVHIAQTDVVYQFHLVPLSSNEFQWSRMVYQFQFPTFKMAVDGIFPPTCLSRQKQISPWKRKKKHLSVVNIQILDNSWVVPSKLVHEISRATSDKVSHWRERFKIQSLF